MPTIEEHIDIAAGATTVFRFCHDVSRRPDWDERIRRAQLVTPKPIRRGSVIRFDTHPPGGAVFSWDGEVVDYHFPRRSKVEVVDVAPSSSFVSGSETWRFTSAGASTGGTRFSLTWDYKPRGILGSILDVLIRRGATRRAIQESVQNLQALIEGEA